MRFEGLRKFAVEIRDDFDGFVVRHVVMARDPVLALASCHRPDKPDYRYKVRVADPSDVLTLP